MPMSMPDEEKLTPAVTAHECPEEDCGALVAGWKRVLSNLKWAAERPPARPR